MRPGALHLFRSYIVPLDAMQSLSLSFDFVSAFVFVICLCHAVDPAESAWMWAKLQYKQFPVFRIKEPIAPAGAHFCAEFYAKL